MLQSYKIDFGGIAPLSLKSFINHARNLGYSATHCTDCRFAITDHSGYTYYTNDRNTFNESQAIELTLGEFFSIRPKGRPMSDISSGDTYLDIRIKMPKSLGLKFSGPSLCKRLRSGEITLDMSDGDTKRSLTLGYDDIEITTNNKNVLESLKTLRIS